MSKKGHFGSAWVCLEFCSTIVIFSGAFLAFYHHFEAKFSSSHDPPAPKAFNEVARAREMPYEEMLHGKSMYMTVLEEMVAERSGA